MTSGPTGIGGLYATVKLDTSQAIRELRRFDSQINAHRRQPPEGPRNVAHQVHVRSGGQRSEGKRSMGEILPHPR